VNYYNEFEFSVMALVPNVASSSSLEFQEFLEFLEFLLEFQEFLEFLEFLLEFHGVPWSSNDGVPGVPEKCRKIQ